MPRIFLLLSDRGPAGAATLAQLALGHLPGCVSESAPVRLAHVWDRQTVQAIEAQIRVFRPDVLHAVGIDAAQTAALLSLPVLGMRPFPRLILSGSDLADDWLARRAMTWAECVLASSPSEVERFRRIVGEKRVRWIPPGVQVVENSARVSLPEVPPDSVTIAAVGNFDRFSGLKTAAWAFDVVKYVSPKLRLLLIGDGPNQATVDRFARSLGYDDYRVHFAGHRDNVPELLASAQFVWITHERGGICVALEAMAAGTPVLAMRTPDVESVVRHGETGWLVPAGDRVALAAKTAELLQGFDTTDRIRHLARQHIRERFSLSVLAGAMSAVYDGRT